MIGQLAERGMLSPAIQLIHALYTDEAERAAVRDSGASIAISPWSELLIGSTDHSGPRPDHPRDHGRAEGPTRPLSLAGRASRPPDRHHHQLLSWSLIQSAIRGRALDGRLLTPWFPSG